MIKYILKKIKPFGDNREIITFWILPPFEDLSIIQGITNIEDLDISIEWLKELIARNIPDSSEPGVIIYQGFLWGSKKSKIVDFLDNGKQVEKQEFDTADFLQLCEEWRDYLIKKRSN